MADETKKRTTSFAKSVEDLVKQPSPLDKMSPFLREAFTRATEEIIKPPESPKEQERQSDERRPSFAPAPGMSLKPRGPVRQSMDRKIGYEKLRAINAAAKKRAASRSRTLSRDFDQER